MGILAKQFIKPNNHYMATEQKKRNWTPYGIGAAICLALGFFFLIDADAVRHDAATGKLWEILAAVFFGLFILAWVLAYFLTKRK